MQAINLRLVSILAILTFGASLAAQQATSAATAPGKEIALAVERAPHEPLRLTAADLKAMSHITVTVHNPHTNADETYSGVRVVELLAKVGAPVGADLHGKALANYVVATGSDGYQSVLALGEVDPSFHPGEVIVADTMNGKALDEHSGPLKLVVTEDKRPARSVRNLVKLEVREAP